MPDPKTNPNLITFTVDVVGDVTGERWVGKFTAKRRLSFKEQLARDNERRRLIGPSVGDPLPRAVSAANIFSELAVRLVDAPSWWRDKDNGTELEDDSVVSRVYMEALEIKEEAEGELKKEADKAEGDLKKTVEADKVVG